MNASFVTTAQLVLGDKEIGKMFSPTQTGIIHSAREILQQKNVPHSIGNETL